MMKPTGHASIVGYSERGLVNALVRFLAADPHRVGPFLEKIDWLDDDVRRRVASVAGRPFLATFIVEPGFADFGNPDLILLLSPETEEEGRQGQPQIFIVEAKITSWADSAMSNEVGMTESGFNSSINGQLSLKYRLARALAEWEPGRELVEPDRLADVAARPYEKGGIDDDACGRPRHLCRNANLREIASLMKPFKAEGDFLENVFYVALTLDESSPLCEFRYADPGCVTAPWYFPGEDERDDRSARQAWSHTGWSGWEFIEKHLPGLLDDPEYKATRRVSIEPVILQCDRRKDRSSGPVGEAIRTKPLADFPDLAPLALEVAELAAGVAQAIPGLDVALRKETGSFSIVVKGSVAAKVLVRASPTGAFVLLGLAGDCSVVVPPRFDQGVRSIGVGRGARPFQCMKIEPEMNVNDPGLVADLQDYFSSLA